MIHKEVLYQLIDSKKAAILATLLHARDEMYLTEIAQKSNVPITSTLRILQELTSLNLVERKVWKTSKLYSCLRNDKTTFLLSLFTEEFNGITEFTKQAKTIPGIQKIIQKGEKTPTSGKVIIIGEHIHKQKIEEICTHLHEQHNFHLSFVMLTPEQYAQMVEMGL